MNQLDFEQHLRAGERYLAAIDPLLRELIERFGPCTLSPNWRQSPYEALVEAVMFQQLNGAAAQAILGRFLSLFPDAQFPAPADLLKIPAEALRAAGLSRQKAAYLRDIAVHAERGVIPLERLTIASLSDEEIITRLTQAHGVGRWTVEMLLIFSLGRLDVLPVDDYGVRQGYRLAAGLPELPRPRALRLTGEQWMPYRTIAAWYFWRQASRGS